MTPLEQLRAFIDEPTQSVYSDAALQERITTAPSIFALAQEIWLEKAARYSRLVDMSEGSSSRKLSQLHTQAKAMAATYGEMSGGGVGGTSRPTRIRPIERA